MGMNQTSSNALISDRLRRWYEGGRKGLQTICEMEGAPDAVKEQVQHWFDQGDARLIAIIEEIKKLE